MESLPDFDALWDYGQPAETEKKFRELLPMAESSGNAAHLAELLTQIARAQGLQRRFEDAHMTLDRVAAMPVSGGGRPKLRLLLERGRAFNSSKMKDIARPLFLEAWELGRAIGEDGLAVDAAHMAAIAETGDAALQWNLTALQLAEASPAPAARKWRKSLHNNLGWTFFESGDFETALGHFEKTRDLGAGSESERIARWSIAKTKRMLGLLDEALSAQTTLLREGQAAGRTEDPYVIEEMAECLYALGRIDEAKPLFARAHVELSNDPWVADNEPERLARLLELA